MRKSLLALGIALAAAPAVADPFPVHYVVGYKFLKANLDDAQSLQFDFYDDAACTSSIGGVSLPVTATEIVFEKVTRVNVPGVKPKPAPIAVVRAAST